MRRSLVALLLVVLVGIFPGAAKENVPLKVIAPDLVIESAEQGAFYDDPVNPKHFKSLNVVPQPHRFLFGWRMKVVTTRKSILVQERTLEGHGKQGQRFNAVPQDGYVYNATDIVAGYPAGTFKKRIFVENVPVVTFTYTIGSFGKTLVPVNGSR